MKNWFLWATLALVLASCGDKSTCHQKIYITNASEIPIKVGQVWGGDDHGTEKFGMRHSSVKYPGEVAYVEIAWGRDCIEDYIEWKLSHPSTVIPYDLGPIYIFDTVTPEQTLYCTADSLLLSYNILGQISLLDIGVDSLKRCDFTFQYPFK